MLNFIWILSIALGASLFLTGVLRRYALASSLLDVPNARSSHTLPTPRGGGLAIVVVFLTGLPVISLLGLVDQAAMWAIFGAGLWIALIGFLDDHGHIPAAWRLLAHFMGSAWGLFWLGGMPPVVIFGYSLDLGWMGQILGLIYLVWLLNLYNFMDGIDGLASIEAVTVCGGGILLYCLGGNSHYWELAMLAVAVMGFLYWNFPLAKIFMGDVGSGFLGLVIGLFTIQAAGLAPQYFWSWLILLGVFIVDATLTLFRRFLQGEKIYEAHRSHAYQVASRHYGSHKAVSLTVAAINMFWLMPLALWVGLGGLEGVVGLVLAYLPLLILANYFKAGVKEN